MNESYAWIPPHFWVVIKTKKIQYHATKHPCPILDGQAECKSIELEECWIAAASIYSVLLCDCLLVYSKLLHDVQHLTGPLGETLTAFQTAEPERVQKYKQKQSQTKQRKVLFLFCFF